MFVRGRVENGVVVLEEGTRLPEGQEVTVVVTAPLDRDGHSVLDIKPVSMGAILNTVPERTESDPLGELLEERR